MVKLEDEEGEMEKVQVYGMWKIKPWENVKNVKTAKLRIVCKLLQRGVQTPYRQQEVL
jgi:hypothetical protein